MAGLVCDLCGGKLMVGAGGIATCDSCGMEHSADRMKEKVQEIKGIVQTDSSHLVGNYLDMAINAYDAGNNAEAEAYCNRIIEVDPTNYEAWMLKGKSAAWQSTLTNLRIGEGINAFSKGVSYAPECDRSDVIEDAKEQIKALSIAIVELQTNRFAQWPDEEETNSLLELVAVVLEAVLDFISQTGQAIALKDIAEPIAFSINESVVQAYQNVIYPEYKSDKYPFPDDDDFYRYVQRIDFCIKLITKAIALCDANEADIQRYENLISLQEKAIESCSFTSKYQDFGAEYGPSHVRRAENIARSYGCIPDAANNRIYGVKLRLTGEAKDIRRQLIKEYKAEIERIKQEVRRIEKEETQRKLDIYWAEHAEEKRALESERESIIAKIDSIKSNLNYRIDEINREIADVPGDAEIQNLDERIKALTAEKNALGVFKGKEKKAIQEQIDKAVAERTAIQNRMNATISGLERKISLIKESAQDEIAPLESRCEEITEELTKER